MFKNGVILHPTDFSEQSEHALQLACSLARDNQARLIVLHVVVPMSEALAPNLFTPPPGPGDYVEQFRGQLEGMSIPAASHIQVERLIREGDPVTEILSVAGGEKADLIVLGTHGRSGLSRLLMGSTAEQVVRQATCPVLTVKLPAQD